MYLYVVGVADTNLNIEHLHHAAQNIKYIAIDILN